MSFPNLSVEQIGIAVPGASDVRYLARGGQKVVFTAMLNGSKWVLKFLRPNPQPLAALTGESSLSLSMDDVTARARREVETLRQCDTPFLVKPGPLPLTNASIEGEDLLFFTEEHIDGEALTQVSRPLAAEELVRLALNISEAIGALWALRKIHRDIKPGNIIRHREGRFVLLDLGLIFALDDESFSLGPVGTPIYFSPEQLDFANRRSILDFRSDLFALGLVLYEMATGQHPFVSQATRTTWDVVAAIRTSTPRHPCEIVAGLPRELGDLVMRLLGKRPALRFRSLESFRESVERLASGDNVA